MEMIDITPFHLALIHHSNGDGIQLLNDPINKKMMEFPTHRH